MTLSREELGALLLSVFVVAVCGLSYELMMGAVATTLLGSSVIWYSLTIGVFLSAMGVGSFLSRFIERDLLAWFIGVEIAVGLVGGCAGALVFLAFTTTPIAKVVLVALLVVIGSLVGLELPLLTRFLEPHGGLRNAISNVMALDYIGALVASLAFPFVLLPVLGLLNAFFAVGLLNLLVAGLTAWVFRSKLSGRFLVAVVVGAMPLAFGMVRSQWMMDAFERRLYTDTVIHTEQSPYQRIVLTRFLTDTRLYLDGHLQFSAKDEYRYHESLIHPAMGLAANHQRVLLLGAGDGLAAREVFRWPDVEELVVVDLDPAITRLGREHPAVVALNEDALNDPRVTIVNADAFTWLAASEDQFPVIVMDFPDPHDDGLAKLYSTAMYHLVEAHLAPGGVAVTQASSPYFARQAYWSVVETVKATGLEPLAYHAWVPAFGDWGFVLMTRKPVRWETLQGQPRARFLDDSQLAVARQFAPDTAQVPVQPNTLDRPVIAGYYRAGWQSFF